MKELSLHILDIAQNSIAADASIVKVTIAEDLSKDNLIIKVEDNGRGMDKQMVEKVKDPFFTSRTTRKVGLGIPLLIAAAKRCDGDVIIESTKGQGTSIIASFIHSHIDRAPLGNMTDTIIGLVICNENIDFVYTHIYNEKQFEFNTSAIRNALKEVPITSPEVVVWMREYLRENIMSLYGGGTLEVNKGTGRDKEENP